MKKLILSLLGLLAMSIGLACLWVKFLKDDIERVKNEKICAEMDRYSSMYDGESRLADSLTKANYILYSQKQLTLAMNYRDSILSAYPFCPGDIALMKPDSSRVLVEDVIVGGGKYNYYVGCVVMKADGTRETVFPEALIK